MINLDEYERIRNTIIPDNVIQEDYIDEIDPVISNIMKRHSAVVNSPVSFDTPNRSISEISMPRTVEENERFKQLGKKGISQTKALYDTKEHIQDELSIKQSNWTKAGNALAQIVVSEGAIGIPKGFADIGDYFMSKIFHVTDDDYQNPISNTLEQWQETFRNEIAPIEVGSNINIINGGLRDFGWWMSNVPSIATTVSLMVPGVGITKGVSYLGKLAKLDKGLGATRRFLTGVDKAIENGKDLNTFQRWINKGTTVEKMNERFRDLGSAYLMRVAENYQEARQAYTPVFEQAAEKLNSMSQEDYAAWCTSHSELLEGIDTTDRNEVAKVIARTAADKTFAQDMGNIIFDFIQLRGARNLGKAISSFGSGGTRLAEIEAKNALRNLASGSTESVGKWTSAKAVLKDVGKNIGLSAIEESTEGIEEIVNYIAQEDGITYGKALLDGTTNYVAKDTDIIDSWTNLQGNLSDYFKDPKLWDSAFWGWMGGIFFGGAVAGARTARNMQNQIKEDKETGELHSFFELMELAQHRGARNEIMSRVARVNDYHTKIDQIKLGNDIYSEKDENGKYKTFDSEQEQNEALERARREYINDIAINAINAGTYENLIDFIQADEVKQASVELGLSTEESIDNDTKELVTDIAKVADRYAKQFDYLDNISAINRVQGRTISVDYLKIMATANTRALFKIDEKNEQISNNDKDINFAITSTKELGYDLPFQSIQQDIEFSTLGYLYAKAAADVRELENQDTLESKIKLRQAIRERDTIKEIVESNYNETYGTDALSSALGYIGNYFDKENSNYKLSKEAIKLTDEKIIENALPIESYVDNVENADDVGKKIVSILRTFNTTADTSLKQINPQLYELFRTSAKLKAEKAAITNQLINDSDKFKEEVTKLNNNFESARQNAIDSATKTIIRINGLYNQSGNSNFIERAISSYYANDKERAKNIIQNTIKDVEDAKDLLDSIEVLDLTRPGNTLVYDYIRNVVQRHNNTLFSQQYDFGVESSQYHSMENTPSSVQNINTNEILQENEPQIISQTSSIEAENEQILEKPPISNTITIGDTEYTITRNETDNTGEVNLILPDNALSTAQYYAQQGVVEIVDDGSGTPLDVDWGLWKKPVVKLGSDGTWNIIEKGIYGQVTDSNSKQISSPVEEITNEQTIPSTEMEEEPTNVSSEGFIETNEMSASIDLVDITSDLSTPSDSLTGEPNSNIIEPPSEEATIDQDIARETLNEAIYNKLNLKFADKIGDLNSDYDTAAIAASLKNEIAGKGNAIGYTDEELNKVIDSIAKQFEFYKSNRANLEELEALAADFAFLSKFDEVDTEDDLLPFYNVAETYLNAYAKRTILTKDKAGRILVRLEDILRSLRKAGVSESEINGLYDIINRYLNNVGKNKYFVLDNETKKEVLIENSKKTLKEKIEDEVADTRYIRINFNDIIVNDEGINEQTVQALNSLKVGDTLTIDKGEKRLYLLNDNGKRIGSLTIPKLFGEAYSLAVKGIITTLTKGNNGVIIGKAKDAVTNLLCGKGEEFDKLRTALLSSKFNGRLKIDSVNTILENAEFQKILNNKELVGDSPDSATIIDGLESILSYALKYTTSLDKNENLDELRQSIDNFYTKLYNSWDVIYNNTSSKTAKLTRKLAGQANKNTDDTIREYDKLSLPSESIVDFANTKLSICVNHEMLISERSTKSGLEDQKNGSTYVSMYQEGSSNPEYVKAIGCRTTDTSSKAFSRIVNASKKVLADAINRVLVNNVSDISRHSDLIETLTSILSTANSQKIALFRISGYGLSITDMSSSRNSEFKFVSIRLTKGEETHTFNIITNNQNGPNLGYFVFGDTQTHYNNSAEYVVEQLFRFLDSRGEFGFNIDKKGIVGDNTNTTIQDGFITRKKGKVKLTIPGTDISLESNSYNDLVLNNDLIRVNTHKADGSNFSFSNRPNGQKLYIDFTNTEGITTKETTTETQEEESIKTETTNEALLPTTDVTKFEAVLNSLKSGNPDIIGTIFTEDEQKIIGETVNELGINLFGDLLPTDIRYESGLNNPDIADSMVINAVSNPSSKRTRVNLYGDKSYIFLKPGQVLVGNKLLNNLASQNKFNRSLGIRKLIHENLHLKISELKNREQVLNAIKEILDKFKENINSTILNGEYDANYTIAKTLIDDWEARKSNPKIPLDELGELEEFLVESITNSNIFNILNNINAEVDNRNENKTLFDKVLEFISKIFNWKIKDNTLLQKELSIIRDIISTNEEKNNKGLSSPVEERSNINQEKQAEKTDEYDDFVYDDSNFSAYSRQEEINASISTDKHKINNTDVFKQFLPKELRQKYKNDKNNGLISLKCK